MRTSVFKGRIIDVGVERVELPNGERCDLEIIRHPGGCGRCCGERATRSVFAPAISHAVGGWLWEIPAGMIDPGEDPLAAATRELSEESGLTANEWRGLGSMVSSPGVFSERVHLYLATVLTQTGAHHDVDEVFELHWKPWDWAMQGVLSGEISDGKSVVALMRANALIGE